MKYKRLSIILFLLLLISLLALPALTQSTGYIQIKTGPNASIFLENSQIGKNSSDTGNMTPKDAPSSTHILKIVKEGYHPHYEQIELKPNEVYFLSVALSARTGGFITETIPLDCIIDIPQWGIDQGNIGTKKGRYWELSDIPIGRYTISFIPADKQIKYNLETKEGVRKYILADILNKKVTESIKPVTWDKTYGGSGADWANSIIQTIDGGYAIAGYTGNDLNGYDIRILKLDEQGNLSPGDG